MPPFLHRYSKNRRHYRSCGQIQQQIRQDLRNMLDLYRVRVDVHIDGLERKEPSNEPS